jgi:hypothetical protein
MKIILSLALFAIVPVAFADCSTAYLNQIKTLEGRMNPPRAALVSNVIAEGAVVATLATVGTIPVTAVVALPAVALGSATYYGILITERNGIRNGMHVIRDAHRGSGATLDRFMKILEHKSDKVVKEEVIDYLIRADEKNEFCELDETKDKFKLVTFKKMLKLTRKDLSL